MSEIVSVDRRPFRLRDGWTREQLMASIEQKGLLKRTPFLCRHGKHRWETVGDVHIPEATPGDFNSLVALGSAGITGATNPSAPPCCPSRSSTRRPTGPPTQSMETMRRERRDTPQRWGRIALEVLAGFSVDAGNTKEKR